MVQRHTVEHAKWNITHQHLCPVIVIATSAGCNTENAIGVIPVSHESGILPVDVGIVLCSHVAATTPGLIANSPEFHTPWFCPSIFFPQIGHRTGTLFMIH